LRSGEKIMPKKKVPPVVKKSPKETKKAKPETSLVKIPPKVQDLAKQGNSLSGAVNALKIIGEEGLQTAASLLDSLAGIEQGIRSFLDPICKATNEAHKAATSLRVGFLDPVLRLKEQTKLKVNGFLAEQQRLRDKADEENQKAQEEYQVKLLKAKNPARVAEPEQTFIPPTPKVEGIAVVKRYFFEVENIFDVPKGFLIPDGRKIQETIEQAKGDIKIPGIRIWSELRSQRS
jgi:hypothetical protein